MQLSLTDSERKALTTGLIYAREVFALAPAHWTRPGVMADIESILSRTSLVAKHGQESKLGFPGSGIARRHISKLLKAPKKPMEEES
jgi:hypothetical protein